MLPIFSAASTAPAAESEDILHASNDTLNPAWQSLGLPVNAATPAGYGPGALRLSILPAAAIAGDQDRIRVHAQLGLSPFLFSIDVEQATLLRSAYLTDPGFPGAQFWTQETAPNQIVAPRTIFAATARSLGANNTIGAPVMAWQEDSSNTFSVNTCCFTLFGSAPFWGKWGSLPNVSPDLSVGYTGYFFSRSVDAAYRWSGDAATSTVYAAFRDAAQGNRVTVLRRTNAESWQISGTAGFTPGPVNAVALYASPTGQGRVFLIAKYEDNEQARVYSENANGQWIQYGTPLTTSGQWTVDKLDLAVHFDSAGKATAFAMARNPGFSAESVLYYRHQDAAGWTSINLGETCTGLETATDTTLPVVFVVCPGSAPDFTPKVRAAYAMQKKVDLTYQFFWTDLGTPSAGARASHYPETMDLAFAPTERALYLVYSRQLFTGDVLRPFAARKPRADEYCFNGQLGSIVCVGG